MKKVVRSSYFLSALLLKNIKGSYIVTAVDEVLDTKEKDKKTFIHKLIKYRVIPLLKIMFVIIYRKLFISKKNEDQTLYFSIDRIDLIASLLVLHRNNIKVSIWLWNPINSIMGSTKQFKIYLKLLSKAGVDIWTFDQKDATDFDLKYHPQIYSSKLAQGYNNNNILYDAFFVGQDKGRLPLIRKIKKCFDACNMFFSIHLIKDHLKKYHSEDLEFFKNKKINYDDYLDLLSKSRCIVEIVQKGQTGLTLRALESLFYDKKLITNNFDIIQYDFYDPANILCINDNTTEKEIYDFLQIEYNVIVNKFKLNYEVEHLLNVVFK